VSQKTKDATAGPLLLWLTDFGTYVIIKR